jgi:hypothetical protein
MPVFTGAPEEIRTPDPQIRSLVLVAESGMRIGAARHDNACFFCGLKGFSAGHRRDTDDA